MTLTVFALLALFAFTDLFIIMWCTRGATIKERTEFVRALRARRFTIRLKR